MSRTVDFRALLEELRASPAYAGQMVHVREDAPRPPRYAEPARPLPPTVRDLLHRRGIAALYSHQAEALDRARERQDFVVATGTASGKSLCYVLPILERLLEDPRATFVLVFPTKALCQDQLRALNDTLGALGWGHVLAGVYDGDTAADLRRRLRDRGSIVLTNPDMLHAALMPQHARWAGLLSRLNLLVLDELHVYSGMFGSNMANLMRRFFRVCAHHGARPQVIGCSGTLGNPGELASALVGRPVAVIDRDGSPRGRRFTVFWDPPTVRGTAWRSRRSANVEAHEIMAALLTRGVPTITFSKAKMTAEMIARYTSETLQDVAPHLARKVEAYRGGYLPKERRQLERDLFEGRLLGVSTTNALELGIDVGGLDASILVGYPGTLASFFQQSGRAGRRDRDSLVVLVGLDTPANQYVMAHPDYLFGRPIEHAVVDRDNPFVIIGHVRCAVHELALRAEELGLFGPNAEMALRVLADQAKVACIEGRWYYAATETPQHEVSLRTYSDGEVVIQDADTGAVVGELNEFDMQPLLHPEAIYIQHGDTYRVVALDEDRRIATVKREDVDYYTYPLGGTDVHHVDNCLREKAYGTGRAYWGEVTTYFQMAAFEKIPFYSLDARSIHGVEMKPLMLDTMAMWVVPPEELMVRLREAGLDAFRGLRGIGYATRMALPLFLTCDTASFSHSVGSANSPWNALFVYERFPLGLGFTEQAYERLHEILPAVLDTIVGCGCEDGCPRCVGKPLRQTATWNVERGEGNIPSKHASRVILEGLLQGDLQCADTDALTSTEEARRLRTEQLLRRRVERMREPKQFHPIEPHVPTAVPPAEPAESLATPDVVERTRRRSALEKEIRKRLAQKTGPETLPATAPVVKPPAGTLRHGAVVRPRDFAPKPVSELPPVPEPAAPSEAPATQPPPPSPVPLGDSLAARARRAKRGSTAADGPPSTPPEP